MKTVSEKFRTTVASLLMVLYVFIVVTGMIENCNCGDSCAHHSKVSQAKECCSGASVITSELLSSDTGEDHTCSCVEWLNQTNMVNDNESYANSPRIEKKLSGAKLSGVTNALSSVTFPRYVNTTIVLTPDSTIDFHNTTVLLI